MDTVVSIGGGSFRGVAARVDHEDSIGAGIRCVRVWIRGGARVLRLANVLMSESSILLQWS